MFLMEVRVWYWSGREWTLVEGVGQLRAYALGSRVEVYGRSLEVVTVKAGSNVIDVYVDEPR